MKIRLHSKRIVITIVCLCVAVALINYGVDKAFYSPHHDFTVSSTTFGILNQLLSPKLTESYLEFNENESRIFFARHLLNFRMLKFSYSRSLPQNTGTIMYQFGRPTLSNYMDNLKVGDLTCRQELFLSPENPVSVLQLTSENPVSAPQSISDNQVYEVWVRFANPIARTVFEEKYGWLLDNDISRPRKCGILWIPVETSDQAEDVCLGLAGNLSFHYMNPDYAIAPPDFYHTDLYGREIAFGQSLEYLCKHPQDTNAFISTGLWQGAETVNFEERYAYIQENGFRYLGFVAYVKGSDLLALEDSSVQVVALIEDGFVEDHQMPE